MRCPSSPCRYAYGNQPVVAEWNLARLAEVMLPLLHEDEQKAVELASSRLERSGRSTAPPGRRVDHTGFFRRLGSAARGDTEPARELVLDLAGFDAWTERWLALQPDADLMDRTNPVYVPRNHLVEEALTAAPEDLAPLERLLEALSAPFDERPGLDRYAEPAPGNFGTTYRTFCGT